MRNYRIKKKIVFNFPAITLIIVLNSKQFYADKTDFVTSDNFFNSAINTTSEKEIVNIRNPLSTVKSFSFFKQYKNSNGFGAAVRQAKLAHSSRLKSCTGKG